MSTTPDSQDMTADLIGKPEEVELLLRYLNLAGSDFSGGSHAADMRRWAASRAAHVIPKLADRIAELEARPDWESAFRVEREANDALWLGIAKALGVGDGTWHRWDEEPEWCQKFFGVDSDRWPIEHDDTGDWWRWEDLDG
ncbi:MAG: hypothetical protein AAGA37_19865 [Actinomycetota bacterium]